MNIETKTKARNVSLILLGIVLLLLKSRYTGPFEIFVHSYAGNVSVSFAVYFLSLRIPLKIRHKRYWTVFIALAAVEFFELFDGFGLMSNVYDGWDLMANLAGVAIAFALDALLSDHQSASANV